MKQADSERTSSSPSLPNGQNRTVSLPILLLLLFPLVIGCRGCVSNVPNPVSIPGQSLKSANIDVEEPQSLPAARGVVGLAMKPGHWYQANQKMTAKGREEVLIANAMIYGPDRKPMAMHSGFGTSVFQRELDLAPKQSKNIRFQIMQPEVDTRFSTNLQDPLSGTVPYLNIQLLERATGAEIHRDEFPIRFLAGYQYNIVNLSRDPSRYLFWQGLPCMVWPSEARSERVMPHRLVDLKEEDIPNLFPNRLFAMTSVSHVVLNDVNPGIFARDQQIALLDWLHFGGTIVVNGPAATVETEASFIRPYLPLSQSSTADWSDKETSSLNNQWTIGEPNGTPKNFNASPDLFMLVGQLHPEAHWVPNLEGFVAERQFGQGRVVMTTFPMADSSFLSWPSYDSLIHNGILRKPPRQITTGPERDMAFANRYAGEELNPKHSTRLRLWARDLDSSTMITQGQGNASTGRAPQENPSSKRSSFGSWNSESAVAQTAKESLQAESGIFVPKMKTILYLLGGYLLCLVPLNWLLFRLIGRVELAWIAAPVIAVISAGVVARATQLDIGFSRSQNTYEILECHPRHSRGLLSSYHSLYTSLSTTYKATFDEDRGVVSPLFTPREQYALRNRRVDTVLEYLYGNPTNNGIQNNSVLSNTTGMVHAEEPVELGGEYVANFDFENQQLTLQSKLPFPIEDLGIIGLSDDHQLQTAWVGSLEPGEEVEISLASGDDVERWLPQWNANPSLSKPDLIQADGRVWTTRSPEDLADQDLYQGALLDLLASKYPLEQGEYIAIGRAEQSTGSLQILPAASQSRRASLVLMHLRAASLPDHVGPDNDLYPAKPVEKKNDEVN